MLFKWKNKLNINICKKEIQTGKPMNVTIIFLNKESLELG